MQQKEVNRSKKPKPQTKSFLVILLFLLVWISAQSQTSLRVLFLGNSYTSSNNLPQIIHDLALTTGDTLIWDSYTPGGHNLSHHNNDPITLEKIMIGDWDYIVLQGQSTETITQFNNFIGSVGLLDKKFSLHDICSVPLLYMTWGRENGHAGLCPDFPVACTYESMDAWIRQSYLIAAADIYSEVSPVSLVWNQIRSNHPDIALYTSDESHPSLIGSYAAACSFYASIFKKDPTLITSDYGLNTNHTAAIRATAKSVIYDYLDDWDFKELPISDFSYSSASSDFNYIYFNSLDYGTAESYFWDFGDGETGESGFPIHLYENNGTYTVSLTTTTCNQEGMHTSTTDTIIQFCDHTPTVSPPNPWLCSYDSLWTQSADSYQWYHNGLPIPDTTQYLPDFGLYNGASLSVLTTINGCSELSIPYTEAPVQSQFWHNISPWADPCIGDTSLFVIHHNNGSLSGEESILWFRDGVALPLYNNEDSLIITSEGLYECLVSDPNSICPLDTVSFIAEYDCSTTALDEYSNTELWKVYPNPSIDFILVDFMDLHHIEEIKIHDQLGKLVLTQRVKTGDRIDISNLKNGNYTITTSSKKYQDIGFNKQ